MNNTKVKKYIARFLSLSPPECLSRAGLRLSSDVSPERDKVVGPYIFSVSFKNAIKISIFLLGAFCSTALYSQKSKWLKEFSEVKKDTNTINACLGLFRSYSNSNPDSAVYFLEKGLGISKQIAYEYGEAQLITCRGTMHFRKTDIDAATKDFNAAMKTFVRLGKISDQANIYRQYGMMADMQGDMVKSAENYLEAIRLAERSGHDKLKASCLGNLGILHERQKHNNEALKYYYEAKKLFIKTGDSLSLLQINTNIGNIHDNLEQLDSAIYYYSISQSMAKRFNHLPMVAMNLNNIANIYHMQAKHEKALEYFEQSLAINEKMGEADNMASNLMQIGNVLKDMKKYGEALPYLQRSLEMAKESNYTELEMKTYQCLSDLYAKQNLFHQAYDHNLKYVAVRDSFLNEENQHSLSTLEKKYQVEKKEQENKLLTAQNMISEGIINQHRITNYFVIIGLVLVSALAVFIFRSYRIKKKANYDLNEKNELIGRQKALVEEQKKHVEEKQKEIVDSINYAKRIQSALMATDKQINKTLTRLIKR